MFHMRTFAFFFDFAIALEIGHLEWEEIGDLMWKLQGGSLHELTEGCYARKGNFYIPLKLCKW
jgi:hypothetical protein